MANVLNYKPGIKEFTVEKFDTRNIEKKMSNIER